METCFSQPISFIITVYTKNKFIWDLFCSGKLNLCSFLLYSVYSGKFEVKERKNSPMLAVNIMQEMAAKETMHQECFIPTLLLCFDRLANCDFSS